MRVSCTRSYPCWKSAVSEGRASIERLVAYAGADCLYAPGLRNSEQVAQVEGLAADIQHDHRAWAVLDLDPLGFIDGGRALVTPPAQGGHG